ncbi:MAG: hypothetical protein AAF636_08205 [Pseudomonadota bacterium]
MFEFSFLAGLKTTTILAGQQYSIRREYDFSKNAFSVKAALNRGDFLEVGSLVGVADTDLDSLRNFEPAQGGIGLPTVKYDYFSHGKAGVLLGGTLDGLSASAAARLGIGTSKASAYVGVEVSVRDASDPYSNTSQLGQIHASARNNGPLSPEAQYSIVVGNEDQVAAARAVESFEPPALNVSGTLVVQNGEIVDVSAVYPDGLIRKVAHPEAFQAPQSSSQGENEVSPHLWYGPQLGEFAGLGTPVPTDLLPFPPVWDNFFDVNHVGIQLVAGPYQSIDAVSPIQAYVHDRVPGIIDAINAAYGHEDALSRVAARDVVTAFEIDALRTGLFDGQVKTGFVQEALMEVYGIGDVEAQREINDYRGYGVRAPSELDAANDLNRGEENQNNLTSSGGNRSDTGGVGAGFSPSSGREKRDQRDQRDASRSETDVGKPVLLDLDDDGIELTELSQSTQFFDTGGDGLLHRTAWAGDRDGVLFIDDDGDGTISEKREFVFTDWDPTAKDDLEALRAAFDSNDDAVLDASDARFADFKVLVTNPDGASISGGQTSPISR